MTDNLNPEDVQAQNTPAADPGNSPPENFTAPLTDEEQQEADAAVETHEAEETAKAEAAEAGRAQADYEVVDGEVVAVSKDPTYQESVEARGATVYGLDPVEQSGTTQSAVSTGDAAVEFVSPDSEDGGNA